MHSQRSMHTIRAADTFQGTRGFMELIVGSFLLVGVSFFGHFGFVVANYLRRSKPAIEA